MSFLHVPLIAIGSLFVSIPILLHLLMRRKPKSMIFPALRFVKRRQTINQRRLKLRHLLLLMLRCAALAALAAALARPFVPSTATGNWLLLLGLAMSTLLVTILAYVAWTERAKQGIATALTCVAMALLGLLVVTFTQVRANPTTILVGDNEPPVAAALIIDRSPRMAYQHENQTRLQKAQMLATWLIDQLPAESDIAVLDTTSSRAAFAVDQETATKSVAAMEIDFRTTQLPSLIGTALQLLSESPHARKEIYIFSDLTESSWARTDKRMAEQIEALGEELSAYVIDVGIPQPANLLAHPPTLSAEHVGPNSALEIAVAVSSRGLSGNVDVELVVEVPDPTLPMIVNGEPLLPSLETRGRSTLTVQDGGSAEVSFALRGLEPGIHHGQIRIQREDGLPVDNTRYFTVKVGDPWKVLLIADPETYGEFISAALAPFAQEGGDSLFVCESLAPDRVDPNSLGEYAAVALVDPRPLEEPLWSALSSYVSTNGSLAVILGRNAQPVTEFNSVGALSVLPGRLLRQFRNPGRNNFLSLPSGSHPMLTVLKNRASTIAWNAYPVFRHWELADLKQSANSVMSFTNGMPAIIESKIGEGRVLTVTTPFTDPLNVPGREPWNLLPTGPEPWPYVVLVNELFRYLVSDGQSKLNYAVGEVASVQTPSTAKATYQMFSPQGSWQAVTAQAKQLVIPLTTLPGTYRIRSTVDPDRQAGFSINVSADQTQLVRIDKAALDSFLGDNYRIATTQEEIARDMSEVRRGREFYPWLMLFLATVLGLESLLSNRFYTSAATDEPEEEYLSVHQDPSIRSYGAQHA